MSESPPQSSQRRVLVVWTAIALNGPLTVEEISRLTNLPMSASYRALQQLIAEGWVEKTVGRTGFVVTHRVRQLLRDGRFGFPFAKTARQLITQLRDRDAFNVDFAVLDPRGRVVLADSTDSTADRHAPLVLTQSILGRAAVCGLETERKATFLRRYLVSAPSFEKQASHGPRFAPLFQFSAGRRFILADGGRGVSFAFRGVDETSGSIALRPKRPGLQKTDVILRWAKGCVAALTANPEAEFHLLLTTDEIEDARFRVI